MAGAPTDALAALWTEVRPHLPEPYGGDVLAALSVSSRLWRIELATGHILALKLGATDHPAANEAGILRWLERQGCPTPRVLASGGGEPGWLATDWCGDATLDDLGTTSDGWGSALAAAVLDVEAALRRALPAGAERGGAAEALRAQAQRWMEAAPDGLGWLLGRPLTRTETALLSQVTEAALACPPAPGSLDYNARNVVVGGRGLRIVDFPAAGYDWTERRLAQYALGTRAAFASALTPEAVAAFAERAAPMSGRSAEEVATCVDAHEVLLILIAARQLMAVEAGEAHPDRSRAWPDVAARKAQLRGLLQRRLAGSGPASQLRLL